MYCMYVMRYIQINTNTYIYMRIHTYTCNDLGQVYFMNTKILRRHFEQSFVMEFYLSILPHRQTTRLLFGFTLLQCRASILIWCCEFFRSSSPSASGSLWRTCESTTVSPYWRSFDSDFVLLVRRMAEASSGKHSAANQSADGWWWPRRRGRRCCCWRCWQPAVAAEAEAEAADWFLHGPLLGAADLAQWNKTCMWTRCVCMWSRNTVKIQ